MVSAGPNHLTVSVDASGPGDLVYLAEFSPLMTVNAPVARDARFNDFYSVSVSSGQRILSFDFLPWNYVATEVATLAMTSTLAALWLIVQGHRRLAPGLCLLVGMTAIALLVFGSTTRHSLGAHELYGLNGTPAPFSELVTSAGHDE